MLAIEISLPAFRKIPHLVSRASVDSTLFTIEISLMDAYFAKARGVSRSVVSPDYETNKTPACSLSWGKSDIAISEPILTSTDSKQPKALSR